MDIQTIDAALLAKMFLAGAKNLDAKKDWINELNVFPVPDGDTGTNMSMTIMSAVKEVSALERPVIADLAKAISSGSLRGARGNSGVILSQLFRGFSKVIGQYEELDKQILCDSLQRACETAYKAVMKPKEGTILTVARGAAEKAQEIVGDDSMSLADYLEAIVAEAERVLALTPDLLPVLKQAGVVDSGGQGLVEFLKGARDAFLGREIDYSLVMEQASSGGAKISAHTEEEIRYGYCTEFLINLDAPLSGEQEKELRGFLGTLGDSIVIVADDGVVKIHVHTNDPGLILQKALTLGSLSRIKIDNMREEHQEKLIRDSERLAREQAEAPAQEDPAEGEENPPKDVGFICVSIGDGLHEVFKGLGVDEIIEGGQTMNPSTEDMLTAIARVNARTVFIFPNNSNIILAANQAAELTKDKEILVIPTTTIPQGVTAMINYVPEQSPQENAQTMQEVIQTVKTGQITYAVRDTVVNDREIREGDYMGLGDHTILSAGTDLDAVAKEMVAGLIDEDSSFICIYYGEGVSEEAANEAGARLEELYPQCEVEVQYGGQPVYYYIISVE